MYDFYTKFYKYEFSYKFDTVFINFLRQEHQIEFMGLDQLLRYLGFSLRPLSFFRSFKIVKLR